MRPGNTMNDIADVIMNVSRERRCLPEIKHTDGTKNDYTCEGAILKHSDRGWTNSKLPYQFFHTLEEAADAS